MLKTKNINKEIKKYDINNIFKLLLLNPLLNLDKTERKTYRKRILKSKKGE